MPKAQANHYDDEDFAAGLCLDASSEFLETLKGREFTIIEPEFDRPGRAFRKLNKRTAALREYIFEPRDLKEAIRRKEDKFLATFPFKTDGVSFHFVVKVGEFVIDWTARQFGAQNPFPAIWKES